MDLYLDSTYVLSTEFFSRRARKNEKTRKNEKNRGETGGSNPNPKQYFSPADNLRNEAGEKYCLGLGLRTTIMVLKPIKVRVRVRVIFLVCSTYVTAR